MAFSSDCLNAVLEAYPPLVDKHKDDEFTEQQKQWQLMRRGRYYFAHFTAHTALMPPLRVPILEEVVLFSRWYLVAHTTTLGSLDTGVFFHRSLWVGESEVACAT